MSRPDHDKLSVHTEAHGGSLVIVVAGVVTLSTADLLAGALRQAVESGASNVIVDLRAVDFIDSSGLSLLVEASKRLRSPETPCAPRVLVTPEGQPERVLKMGRFTRILDVHAVA